MFSYRVDIAAISIVVIGLLLSGCSCCTFMKAEMPRANQIILFVKRGGIKDWFPRNGAEKASSVVLHLKRQS